MRSKFSFEQLSEKNQRIAQRRFFNAGANDGYLYELDFHGCVLCRRKEEIKIPLENLPDKMLYVDGSKRSFRCECGCNVFKEIKQDKFRCNSCKEIYTSEIEASNP